MNSDEDMADREISEDAQAENEETQAGAPEKKLSFFRRHLSYEYGGRKRLIFDAIVGGVMPPLLLLFDPFVFRSVDSCVGPAQSLVQLRVFAYVASGLGVIAFLSWMRFRERIVGKLAAAFAGIFLTGGLFAAAIGIRMLPYTLVGLLFIVGALGLTPFLIAIIYFKHSQFAREQARANGVGLPMMIVFMVIGSAIVLAPPALLHMQVTSAIERNMQSYLADPSDQTTDAAVERLQAINRVCLGLCMEIVEEHVRDAYTRDRDRGEELTEFYQRVSGEYLYLYDCSTV